MRLKHILAPLAALVSTTALAASGNGPQVKIDTGIVAGAVDGDTQVFRGIPYAAPPVGPRRWRPPVAPIAWRGVRHATSFGASCPQGNEHKEPWAQVGAQSEDCLFLNVWRPTRPGTYPVMVFFHGGGFSYGATNVPLYDGVHLARRGVVLVTMNYRLGRLGFFAHPALTAENPDGQLGNYGIMDQVAALQWVKRNIARFGGDPANVTIFGESAGAGTVQILIGSPVGRGLFSKAISESGSGYEPLAPIRGGAINAEALGAVWAASVGVPNATAAQLRAIPLATIVKGRGFPFVDGKVVTSAPGEPFLAHAEQRIPLMIGSNSNEGSLIGNKGDLARPILGAAYPELLHAYAKRPGSTPESAAIDLVEDAASVLPSLGLADLHAANGARAYAFYFDHVSVDERAGSIGAQHGGEIEFLFGNKPAEHRWDAKDERVSRLMGDYWVRFARAGDPNGGSAPVWHAVGAQPTDYQVIAAATHGTTLTPLEQRVQALALETAKKQWNAAR